MCVCERERERERELDLHFEFDSWTKLISCGNCGKNIDL